MTVRLNTTLQIFLSFFSFPHNDCCFLIMTVVMFSSIVLYVSSLAALIVDLYVSYVGQALFLPPPSFTDSTFALFDATSYELRLYIN